MQEILEDYSGAPDRVVDVAATSLADNPPWNLQVKVFVCVHKLSASAGSLEEEPLSEVTQIRSAD